VNPLVSYSLMLSFFPVVIMAGPGRVGSIAVALAFLIFLLAAVAMWLAPILIGVIWVRDDADRIGQPGWLWALLTIPLGWVAIIAYLVVRALQPAHA